MAAVNCKGADFCRLSEEILSRGASLRFRAQGNSMGPFIRDGDILVIAPIVDVSHVQPGDVILFRQGARVLAHRLLSRRGDGGQTLRVKGDAHIKPDPPLRADRVLGKVTSVERAGRTVDLERRIVRLAALWLWSTPPFVGSRAYALWRAARRTLVRAAHLVVGSGPFRSC